MSGKENNKMEPRVILWPASSGETGLFYALSKEQDEKLGTVGHLRIDFGSNGHEFWHTWWPRDYERPYSSAFESDLKMVVDALREDGPLESFSAMQQYCSVHGGKIEGGWQQNYGYVMETEHYRYCLRCNPAFGDYQAYLTVYDLHVQQMNLKQEAAVPNETAEQINEHEIRWEECNMKKHPEWLKFIKEQYPPGTRIRLIEMNDPYSPVSPGTEGTVNFIDDQCQLHMDWDNGRTLALIPGVDRFCVIQKQLQTLKLYMPLTVRHYEKNEWGDTENEPVELDNRTALAHENDIVAALLKARMPQEAERGLMEYYDEDDSINRNVQSYVFTVEPVNGKLMGVAECRVHGELTAEELDLLKEAIIGQAADGFGEEQEQRPIKTSAGEIYVSLWNGGNSWSIMTQEELEQGQKMGGMHLG